MTKIEKSSSHRIRFTPRVSYFLADEVEPGEAIICISAWRVFAPILWLWLGLGFLAFISGLLS